jgi:hypothetical protein
MVGNGRLQDYLTLDPRGYSVLRRGLGKLLEHFALNHSAHSLPFLEFARILRLFGRLNCSMRLDY